MSVRGVCACKEDVEQRRVAHGAHREQVHVGQSVLQFEKIRPNDQRGGVEGDGVQVHPEEDADLVAALQFLEVEWVEERGPRVHACNGKCRLGLQVGGRGFGAPCEGSSGEMGAVREPFTLAGPEVSVDFDF